MNKMFAIEIIIAFAMASTVVTWAILGDKENRESVEAWLYPILLWSCTIGLAVITALY